MLLKFSRSRGFWPLILIFLPVLALAATDYLPQKRALFFKELSSPLMEVIEPGSPYYEEGLEDEIWVLKILRFFFRSDLLGQAPTGEPRWFSADCRLESRLQEMGGQSPLSLEGLYRKFRQHIDQCQAEMETGWNDIFSNTIGAMSLSMDPSHHPFARHVMFHLPNNIKLKGLLAMKTDGKRRPLIIFRTGIFSNTQAFIPERFLFMQAFEQSPFHVLVLESLSGAEFVKHNTSISLGGFDEGLQNFLIARELQNPEQPISKWIEGVHLLGLSMGSHGVMFASLLNELNPGPRGQAVIQSALVYCPLLNMRDTLDYHLSQGLSMDIMNFWASRRLPELKTRYPDLDSKNFVVSLLRKIETSFQGPLIAEAKNISESASNLNAVSGIRLPSSKPDFWAQNDFWSSYKNVKTPVLIFATRKDPVVSWFMNSGRIEDGRMNFSNSNLKMIPLEQGYHCSLPVAYDWHQQTTLLQSYFLNFSPQFHLSSKEYRAPLSKEVLELIKGLKTEPVLKTQYTVPLGSTALRARVQFQKVPRPNVLERFFLPEISLELPLSEMEFPIEKEGVSSQYESELLRRWAHQNITVQIEGPNLLFRWKRVPPRDLPQGESSL